MQCSWLTLIWVVIWGHAVACLHAVLTLPCTLLACIANACTFAALLLDVGTGVCCTASCSGGCHCGTDRGCHHSSSD
jgi:hypothetical protein